MKKVISFLLLIFSAGVLNSQIPTVVTDPTNAAINSTIQALQEGSNRMQDFMSRVEKAKYASDAIEALNSVKQIADLIDQLACLTTEFQLLYNSQNSYSCATFLNLKMVTFNLNYTTDVFSKVFLAKNLFTMTQSEQLLNLEVIRKTLENTVKELQYLNSAMKINLKEKLTKTYVKQNYYNNSKGISLNRYNK